MVAASIAITSLVNSSIYPILAKLWGFDKVESFNRLQTINIVAVGSLATLGSCGLVLFGDLIATLLSLGRLEVDSVTIFLFGIFVIVSSHNSVLTNFLLSTNTIKTLSIVSFFEAVAKLLLSYGLIKSIGLTGAPASSSVVCIVISSILISRLKKIGYHRTKPAYCIMDYTNDARTLKRSCSPNFWLQRAIFTERWYFFC